VFLELTEHDDALLRGEGTRAEQLAMRIVTKIAEVMGARRLLDVTGAHIDGCLYHGRAGLDFAERLVAGGGRVAIPTTLNVTSLDALHPDLYRGDQETARLATRLKACYEAMGCRPTWTCAPYQLPERPRFGEHIAWAESNAIVFANSVLGARTHRYGDFMDIAAAITGRAPAAGLHLTENRRGAVLFVLKEVPNELLGSDVLFPVLGHLIGRRSGDQVPVIEGLSAGASEDQLKALGAAAASSGSVALFHAIGITPEAPTRHEAFQDTEPDEVVLVTPALLRAARDELTTAGGVSLDAVCLGTPHASLDEIEHLVALLADRRVHPGIEFFMSTSRAVLQCAQERGWVEVLEAAGVQPVADTCTYLIPTLGPRRGVVMTNSGKWAFYAPSNLGVGVIFGSTEECVASAIAGEVRRDDRLWLGS